MRSRYEEAYTRSLRDPEGFWAAAAEDIYWERRWDRVLDDSRAAVLPLVRRRRAQHLLQRARPPRRPRPRRADGADLRQPGHRHRHAPSPTSSCATRSRASPARCARQGVDKGDRVIIYMPMVPEAVIAMLACARIGAVHSVVFGGFAANELATRIDDAKPEADRSRPPAASRAAGSSPTSRCSTARSTMAAHKPERCVILQRPQEPATLVAGPRPRLGRGGGGGQPGRVRAGRGHRSALHPLHLGHDRHAQGRGARQRRPRRRAQVDAWRNIYGVGPGRGVLGGLGHRLGGRPLLHRLRAAAARLHHHPLRGQAGRHAGSRRLLARDRRSTG